MRPTILLAVLAVATVSSVSALPIALNVATDVEVDLPILGVDLDVDTRLHSVPEHPILDLETDIDIRSIEDECEDGDEDEEGELEEVSRHDAESHAVMIHPRAAPAILSLEADSSVGGPVPVTPILPEIHAQAKAAGLAKAKAKVDLFQSNNNIVAAAVKAKVKPNVRLIARNTPIDAALAEKNNLVATNHALPSNFDTTLNRFTVVAPKADSNLDDVSTDKGPIEAAHNKFPPISKGPNALPSWVTKPSGRILTEEPDRGSAADVVLSSGAHVGIINEVKKNPKWENEPHGGVKVGLQA